MLYRRICWVAALGMLAAALGQEQKEQKPPRISIEDLKKRIDEKKDLFFLDVREPKEIEELGSLKGYVNIPLSQLASRLNEVPKDRFIVTA
jgi:rhodanese-related sulfurtransferase